MRVAGLELIKLSHISLDICLCCPSLEYIKMELHKFNSTKFLMNTQQPSKLNTKTKRNTNFLIPALEVPLLPRSYDCLVDVWKVSGLRLRAASGAKGYFGWMKLTCQNNTNSVMLTQYHFNVKKTWRAFCWDTCFEALPRRGQMPIRVVHSLLCVVYNLHN